jgi:hypothetical protein
MAVRNVNDPVATDTDHDSHHCRFSTVGPDGEIIC